jgi:hypothetical protein
MRYAWTISILMLMGIVPVSAETPSALSWLQQGALQCGGERGCAVACTGTKRYEGVGSVALFQSDASPEIVAVLYAKNAAPIASLLLSTVTCNFDGFGFSAEK